MATVNENVQRIKSAKASIRNAIEAKGVAVPADALIDTYAAKIDEIQAGGGGTIDWSVLGYTEEDMSAVVIPFNRANTIAEDIASSKEAWDRHPDGNFDGETGLVYCPRMIIKVDVSNPKPFNGCINLSYIPDGVLDIYNNMISLRRFFENTNISKTYDLGRPTEFEGYDLYYKCNNLKEVYFRGIEAFKIDGCFDTPELIIGDAPNIETFIVDNYSISDYENKSWNVDNYHKLKYFRSDLKIETKCNISDNPLLETVIIDTSGFNNFLGLFSDSSNLKYVEIKNNPHFSESSIGEWFQASEYKLEYLSLGTMPSITSLRGYGLDFEKFPKLSHLGEIDCTNVGNIDQFFFGTSSRYEQLYYFGGFKNVKVDFDITMFSNLSKESYESIIDNLYDFQGAESHTAIFYNDAQNIIPQEYIQKATDKGWTISFSY